MCLDFAAVPRAWLMSWQMVIDTKSKKGYNNWFMQWRQKQGTTHCGSSAFDWAFNLEALRVHLRNRCIRKATAAMISNHMCPTRKELLRKGSLPSIQWSQAEEIGLFGQLLLSHCQRLFLLPLEHFLLRSFFKCLIATSIYVHIIWGHSQRKSTSLQPPKKNSAERFCELSGRFHLRFHHSLWSSRH